MPFQPSYFKADFFKVLSNPTRIQILDALRQGELCVNDIAGLLEIEATTISQQLAVLRNQNFVKTRKHGNQVFYAVQDRTIFDVLDAALVVFDNHLVNLRQYLEQSK